VPELDEAATSDEWRVEVDLDDPDHGYSIAERLAALAVDDKARERLGGKVLVTRDGSKLFLYARDRLAAQEAESVVRQLLDEEKLSARVTQTRWHPVEEAWEPASVPLPGSEEEIEAERALNEARERREAAESGEFDWEVGVYLPSWRDTFRLAKDLEAEGLNVERRWKFLGVGAITEQRAEELAEEIRAKAPEDAEVEVLVNPDTVPTAGFVRFGWWR
jgi:hypothetical protein